MRRGSEVSHTSLREELRELEESRDAALAQAAETKSILDNTVNQLAAEEQLRKEHHLKLERSLQDHGATKGHRDSLEETRMELERHLDELK